MARLDEVDLLRMAIREHQKEEKFLLRKLEAMTGDVHRLRAKLSAAEVTAVIFGCALRSIQARYEPMINHAGDCMCPGCTAKAAIAAAGRK